MVGSCLITEEEVDEVIRIAELEEEEDFSESEMTQNTPMTTIQQQQQRQEEEEEVLSLADRWARVRATATSLTAVEAETIFIHHRSTWTGSGLR